MLKKFAFLLAMGVVATMATTTQAGLLETFAPFDGVMDILEDNSRAQVFRDDGGGYERLDWDGSDTPAVVPLEVGDIIVGLIRIDQVSGGHEVQANEHLIGMFSLTITGFTVVVDDEGGVHSVAVHDATAFGTGLSLNELIDSSHYSALGITGTGAAVPVSGGLWDDAAFAIFEKVDSYNPVADVTTDGLAIIEAIGDAGSGWTLDAVAGFGKPDDFLHVEPGSPTSINNPSFNADERAGVSVLAHSLGAGTQFIAVNAIPFGGPTTKHDMVIVPVTQVNKSDTANWNLKDSAFLRINILPEPGSMTLLSLGLLGLAGAGYRRRKAEQVNA